MAFFQPAVRLWLKAHFIGTYFPFEQFFHDFEQHSALLHLMHIYPPNIIPLMHILLPNIQVWMHIFPPNTNMSVQLFRWVFIWDGRALMSILSWFQNRAFSGIPRDIGFCCSAVISSLGLLWYVHRVRNSLKHFSLRRVGRCHITSSVSSFKP